MDNNGKILERLARIEERQQNTIAAVQIMRGDLREWRKGQERRVTGLEVAIARLEEQQEADRRRGGLADIAAFVSAVIAGIVGVVKQP
jgi:hypothetical protein